MPRKLKLTWIGSLKQWKKVYKGTQHWLGTGKSRDDMQSYKLALEEFERRKVKIDADARAADKSNPYAPWQNSLASREGVEPEIYLVSPKAVPDSPQSIRNRETIGVPTIMSSVPYGSAPVAPAEGGKLVTEYITDYLAYQKLRYLHGLKFPDAPQAKRIGGQRLIAYQNTSKLLSACWADQKLSKSESDVARMMIEFRNECEELLVAETIKKGTYNERIKTLRHFVGWLHDNYLIDNLPRKTDEICAKYKTDPSARAIDVPVVQKLFSEADDTLKTFIALAVNCGFNVGDLANLTPENFQGQYIRYNRHKTGVPIRHRLWPITQELLNKHPSGKKLRFETEDGDPLLIIDVETKQRKSKIDNKFSSLCYRLKIEEVSFSNFRDTSSTWFESDPHHRHLADLFENHKDKTMAQFYKDPKKVDVDRLFSPLNKATDEMEAYYALTLTPPQKPATEPATVAA